MLDLVVGIVFALLAFDEAKRNGRSPLRWVAISVATFLATEILVAISSVFIVALGVSKWGWAESSLNKYRLQLIIASLSASIFTGWLVLRFIKKVPVESFDEPPLPPTFESSESKLFQKCLRLFQKSVENSAYGTKPIFAIAVCFRCNRKHQRKQDARLYTF